MAKSEFAKAVDQIQRRVRPLLSEAGFRVRGRTFNRVGPDGLTHVVNFQMGPHEPPAWTPIPGVCESLHGLFTINLGVFVPEVARVHALGVKSWVQDYDCCVRSRLEHDQPKNEEVWWPAIASDEVIERHRAKDRDGRARLPRPVCHT